MSQQWYPEYQARDADIVDYQEFALAGCDVRFRGPALDPWAQPQGSFFTCLGAAQTYGCYYAHPYPQLLAERFGMPALNLAVGGTGPGGAGMAGKAQGIPTIMLQGQGTTGGHAWVGYMGSPGKWSLDVARYREGKYASGVTWDPQTWRRITDSQLVLLNREPNTTNAALKGRLLARWALMNKSAENYPRLLGIAREAWPHSFDIWQLQAACLEERNLPPPSRKARMASTSGRNNSLFGPADTNTAPRVS